MKDGLVREARLFCRAYVLVPGPSRAMLWMGGVREGGTVLHFMGKLDEFLVGVRIFVSHIERDMVKLANPPTDAYVLHAT